MFFDSEPLPSFDEPPVVETVLSVQFDVLPAVQTAHLGLLWNKFRDQFPITAEHPPLEAVNELFPERPVPRAGIRLETYERPPTPRLSFANAEGSEMIQVQNDRFIKNWRKGLGSEQYPRYERKIRPNFDRDFLVFKDFLQKNGLGSLHVNQCEVIYVNHIIAGEGWEHYGEVHRIFSFWQNSGHAFPGTPEDLRMHLRFVIRDPDHRPVGRLHVDLQPAVRVADNRPMYVLQLTARGQMGDSEDFLDVGRQWIVRTFRSITTESMHGLWKRNS